ncbi:MAG: FAD-dependent oxidoreductase [Limnochordia bacterium]
MVMVMVLALASLVNAQVVQKVDVVVVGGGGAGLLAAIAASDEGADVVVLEKMPFVGGATLISGAVSSAAGTRAQLEAGLEDSAELFFLDLMQGGQYTNDARLTWMMAEQGGAVLDWMEDLGVGLALDIVPRVEHRVPRALAWEGGGAGLFRALSQACAARDIPVLLQTRALELTMTDGRVDGVVAVNKDGEEITFKARYVILATGGYGANMDMRPEKVKDVLYYGPVSSTGDGHRMAEAVGAKLHSMDKMKVYPHGVEIAPTIGKSTSRGSRMAIAQGAIFVNNAGKRVIDETTDMVSLKNKTLQQPDGRVFLVMDATQFEIFKTSDAAWSLEEIEGYLQEPGRMVRSDDLATAAKEMGIDPQGLLATVEAYNDYVRQGRDPEFGRGDLPAPIAQGPSYIVEQKPRTATTLGGLKVTLNMEVLDAKDQPIPGLLAAGEIIAGAHGEESMPGCATTWAFVSGKIAGEYAARQ